MRGLSFLLLLALVTPGSADETLRASVVDTDIARAPTQTVAPVYPRKARRDRIEGEVQVCFDIDRKGRPRRVAVRHSSHRAFERPSLRAVKASRFKPLDNTQQLQPIKSCRTFIFSLQPIPVESSA